MLAAESGSDSAEEGIEVTEAFSADAQDVQKAIQEFGAYFKKFEFQKAKQFIFNFRSKKLTITTTPQQVAWFKLLMALEQISDCDNKYYPLTFLSNRKGMFRKDCGILKPSYQNVATSLQAAIDEIGEDSTVGVHLLSQCLQYVLARVEMMSFYEEITILDMTQKISWNDRLAYVERVSQMLESCHHPDLSAVAHLFQEEVGILKLLISAQLDIQQCRMFNSLLQLKEVRERFDFWIKELSTLNPSNSGIFSKILGEFSSRDSEPAPRNRLISWFIKFYDLLMAKFSLYFINNLDPYSSPDDLKCVCAIDNKYNFIDNFNRFLKSSGASLAGIVMDRSGKTGEFYGFGYNRLEKRFSTSSASNPLEGNLSEFPYVFRCESGNVSGDKSSQASFDDGVHNIIGEFIESVKKNHVGVDNGREPFPLPRKYSTRTNKQEHLMCVTGDHLEGALYIVIVFKNSSVDSRDETRTGVVAFVQQMQKLLRGSILMNDLRVLAK